MKVITLPADLITYVHAAEHLGVSRQAVQKRVKTGQLRVYEIDGIGFVRQADVESWKRERENNSDSNAILVDADNR